MPIFTFELNKSEEIPKDITKNSTGADCPIVGIIDCHTNKLCSKQADRLGYPLLIQRTKNRNQHPTHQFIAFQQSEPRWHFN
jgi:hypothetical protein